MTAADFAKLSERFPAEAIEFLPRNVKNGRALALPYVSTATVIERLNAVCGIDWADAYRVLPNGCVECTLTISGISRTDVGSPSAQPDSGDSCKAAYSDALKRAARKFGLGLYLSECPPLWVDYDEQKRRFVKEPQLPSGLLPPREARRTQESRRAAPATTHVAAEATAGAG